LKTLKNADVIYQGKQVVDGDAKEPMTVLAVIKIVLNNTQYENRAQLRRADKLYAKLDEIDGEEFELEDAEFELVFELTSKYKPILAGRAFVDVFDELDRAKEGRKKDENEGE
jgi:hypothetical protein